MPARATFRTEIAFVQKVTRLTLFSGKASLCLIIANEGFGELLSEVEK